MNLSSLTNSRLRNRCASLTRKAQAFQVSDDLLGARHPINASHLSIVFCSLSRLADQIEVLESHPREEPEG